MLPTVNRIGMAFRFALEADCWFEQEFSVRDVNESGVLCCPLSQSSARLGPPCACMTWKYIFCCACRSIF